MIELIRVASEVQALCETESWKFCFIGGVALQRWGEPRETVDVDLTLLTGFGGEEPFIQKLLERFQGRVEDPAGFARARRVLLLRSGSGVGIDIALGALPFEESAVARASPFIFPENVPLQTCSAEDLIVMKAFASRGRDWVDIEGIIIRQTGKLDWTYVAQQLGPLARVYRVTARNDGKVSVMNRLRLWVCMTYGAWAWKRCRSRVWISWRCRGEVWL